VGTKVASIASPERKNYTVKDWDDISAQEAMNAMERSGMILTTLD